MVKRMLNEDEVKLASKVLERKEKDLVWLNYQLKYYDLMLSEGLEVNYVKTRQEFNDKRRGFQSELDMTVSNVEIMKDQIENGVDEVEADVNTGEREDSE